MSESSEQIKPTVLIADDAADSLMVLQKTLEKCNCNVVATAEDGEQAIELLEQHNPDLVFLDIEMPNKTGLEVLDVIKERNISVCPIMVSGHSSKENLTSAIKRGAQGFIVKPHTQQKIDDIISSYLAANKK